MVWPGTALPSFVPVTNHPGHLLAPIVQMGRLRLRAGDIQGQAAGLVEKSSRSKVGLAWILASPPRPAHPCCGGFLPKADPQALPQISLCNVGWGGPALASGGVPSPDPPRDPGPSLPLPQTAQTGCSRPDHSPQLLPHPQPCPTGPRWDLGPPLPPLLPAARRAPCQLIRNQAEGGRATLLPPLMWGQKLPQPGTLPCSAPPPGWGGHHFCTPCRCPLWPREQPAGA